MHTSMGKITWPIWEKGITRQIEGDLQFRDLKSSIKKPSRNDRTTSATWILETIWKLEDQRMALGRKSRSNQGERKVLTQRFQAALKEDRRSRVNIAE